MPQKTGDVLSWASDADPDTLEQAQKTAGLPFVSGHLALMPDAHVGKGSTIGSVIPTTGAIIPSAIGVDIGCGMIAVETSLTGNDLPDTLTGVHSAISKAVPAGVGQGHKTDQRVTAHHWPKALLPDPVNADNKLYQTAGSQFGSLGSGNHFVEICLDENDAVWVVLHSGSRGVGNKLATLHIDGAKKLMKRYFIDLPDPDLAYLVEGTSEFRNYIYDMRWAQEYALGNREVMMDAVLDVLAGFTKPYNENQRINCHHNYTEMENHGDKNVYVTRKGAIRARKGDLGVIPGSMGTSSYIVEGLGNPSSYNSASHGAGRRLARGKARRTLDVNDLVTAMQGKAWNASKAHELLDESPEAYKDIDQVMEDQKDLVTIKHKLTQILNYKGQ